MANFSITSPLELANSELEIVASSVTMSVPGTDFIANSGGIATFVNNSVISNTDYGANYGTSLPLSSSPSNLVNLSVRPSSGQIYPRSI